MGIYSDKIIIPKDTCTPMFFAMLFTIVRTWMQPKCPSTEERIKKIWYIYNVTPPSWASFSPPPHPGQRSAPSRAPCAVQRVPTSCLFYTWWWTCISPSLPVHPTHALVHLLVIYICISIPALQIDSSVPFL